MQMTLERYFIEETKKDDVKDAELFYESVKRLYLKIRLFEKRSSTFSALSILAFYLITFAVLFCIIYLVRLFEIRYGREALEIFISIGMPLGLMLPFFAGAWWFRRHVQNLRTKLSEEKYAFCVLFECITKLSYYDYSSDGKLLKTSTNLLRRYLNNSEFHFEYYLRRPSRLIDEHFILEGQYIADFLSEVDEKYEWIEITENTKKTLNTLLSIEEKIQSRIKKGVEIHSVIQLLLNLALYEKTKFRPFFTPGGQKEPVVLKQEYFFGFISLLDNLSKIDSEKGTRAIWNIRARLTELIYSDSIFTAFFARLIIFQSAILIIISPLMYLYSLKMDTTILVGIVATPFAAAAALVGFKNKNQSK